ncbi:MAG: hypothetical protein J6M17_02315 [Ruminococcus sp.]|nr:hypothetical protein [Ruminococcus sp.]
MTFEQIYNLALDAVNKRVQGGEYIGPDETVCVICSQSGKMYTGISHIEMMNGAPMSIHAEIDAIRKMQSFGEVAIASLVLMNSLSRSPMLPCNGCVSYIMSLTPDNASAVVMMPDRMIRLPEVSMFAGGGAAAPQGVQPYGGMSQNMSGYRSQSVPAPNTKGSGGGSSKGDLLKDRVSNIMSIADDDDDDDEFLEELAADSKKKGLFGGLFGGKK